MKGSSEALNNKLKYLKKHKIQSPHYADVYSMILSEFVWSISSIDKLRKVLNWKILSSSNDVIWSEDLIEYFSRELCWNELSCNISLPWSNDFIKKFQSNWNWKELSKNQALPFDLNLILAYKDKWHIENLISNPKIQLCPILLDEFKPKLTPKGWFILSTNTSINWNLSLIEKYKDEINWDFFTFNGMPHFQFSNKDFLFFILKYGERLNKNINFYKLKVWCENFNKYEVISLNNNVSIDEELIEIIKSENYSRKFKTKPLKTIEINFFLLLLQFIDEIQLSKLGLPKKMNNHIIENFELKVNFNDISSMKEVSWNEEIIAKHEQKWNWNKLINNEAITWTNKMIGRFACNLNWKGKTCGGHPSRYYYVPSEVTICTSRTFILSSEILEKYAIHWCKIKSECIDGQDAGDWEYFSRNGNITSEILMNFCDQLNFEIISERDIYWNIEEIKLIAKRLRPIELDKFLKKDKVYRVIVMNNLFKL